MSAAKTIEIIGRSTQSSDDAVRHALDEARRTVRNITGVDVVSKGLRGDDLSEWRALGCVAFVRDRDEGANPPRRPGGARGGGRAPAAARGGRRGGGAAPRGARGLSAGADAAAAAGKRAGAAVHGVQPLNL